MNKGIVSNSISASLLGLGLILPRGSLQELVLATGLLSFTGGITNALGVKILFDKIPALPGSGVIPARFREFRSKLKQLFLERFLSEREMRQFFARHSSDFRLQDYIKESEGRPGLFASLVEKRWDKLSSPETLQPIVDGQMEELLNSSVGGILMMVGIDTVKPAVNQFVSSLLSSLKGKVVELCSKIDSDELELTIDEGKMISELHAKIHLLTEEKLEELDPGSVKQLMEDVVRGHLGWLVVWGNILGALIGAAAFLVSHSSLLRL